MRRRLPRAIAAAAAVTFVLAAGQGAMQQSPRTQAPGQTRSVEGRVVDQAGQGVPRAAVCAAGPSSNHCERVDDTGHFVLTDLPEGPFRLTSGCGYYGQRSWTDEPKYVDLQAGQTLKNLIVPCWPAGHISGRVTDDAGEPVVWARVDVFERGGAGGRRMLVRAREEGYVGTDEDGRFRLSRGPGEFFICVTSAEWRAGARSSRVRVFAPTWFPNVIDIDDARPISLSSGEERVLDVQLTARDTVSVSGIVEDTIGPAADAELALEGEPAPRRSNADANGRFTFHGVLPGEYVIGVRASTKGAKRPDVGVVRLAVGDQDVKNLAIKLGPPPAVRGQIVFDGATVPLATQRDQVSVLLYGAQQRPPTRGLSVFLPFVGEARLLRDGTFAGSAEPGRYVIKVHQIPDGWMVRSVVRGGRDVTDRPIDVGLTDIGGFVITLTDRIASVRGRVNARPGVPLDDARVWIYPAERERWMDYGPYPERMPVIDLDPDGSFVVEQLPAGDYYAVAVPGAVDDPYDTSWRDAQQLAALTLRATAFSVQEGEVKTLALDVGALPRDSGAWSRDVPPMIPAAMAAVRPADQKTPVAPRATSTLTGRVVVSGSRDVVSGATVALDPWSAPPPPPPPDVTTPGTQVIQATLVSVLFSEPSWPRHVAVTDRDGSFTIEGVEAGKYTLRVTKGSFLDSETPLVITSPQTPPTIEVPILRGGVIAGVIRDEGKRPLEGAYVRVAMRAKPNVILWCESTNDRGEFRAWRLGPGEYVVFVNDGGPEMTFPLLGDAPLVLGAGEERPFTIVLKSGRDRR